METGLTFSSLFSKIVAEAHPRLVDKELSHSSLDEVQIGLTKDSLSIADEQLNVDDVCAMFGQHVKFIVSQTLALVREDAQSASAFSTLPNAFEVLIASQKTVDKVTLPLKIQERNKKDKLLDDLVSFFESKGWDSRLSESLRVLLPHVFCMCATKRRSISKEGSLYCRFNDWPFVFLQSYLSRTCTSLY